MFTFQVRIVSFIFIDGRSTQILSVNNEKMKLDERKQIDDKVAGFNKCVKIHWD